MSKKFVHLLILLFFVLIFCGVSSAATLPTMHNTNFKKVSSGYVDLQPTSISVATSGSYIVKLGVKNKGSRTSNNFVSSLYINNKYITQVKFTAVKPGKTVYSTVVLDNFILYRNKIGTGTNTFKNVVDPKNTIKESNDKNNLLSEKIYLHAPYPFVQVVECVLNPKSAVTKRKVTDGVVFYYLAIPVDIKVILKNISGYPLKKISVSVGAYPNVVGSIVGNNTTDFSANPVKPGEMELFNIKGKVIIASFEILKPIAAKIVAIAVDTRNVRGMLAERYAGHEQPNAFIPK